MRNVAIGLLVVVGLFAAAGVGSDPVDAAHEGRNSPGAGGHLITHTLAIDEHRDHLVVVDSALRSVGVYQIDRDSGEISLKSVRNVGWDLNMEQFNSPAPRPREIRGILQQP